MQKLILLKDIKVNKNKSNSTNCALGLIGNLNKVIAKEKKIVKNPEKGRKTPEVEFNPFQSKMETISEVRIYLSEDFSPPKTMKKLIESLEQQFALALLLKMNLTPTKMNIAEVIKCIPLGYCDVNLSLEQIREDSYVRLIHVYPNIRLKNEYEKLKNLLSSIPSNNK